MIVWTIYLTFAGAVLLLVLPQGSARCIALATADFVSRFFRARL